MADTNTPTPDSFDTSDHNADIAQKLKDQDIAGKSTSPDPHANAGGVLDDLMKAAEKKVDDEPQPDPEAEKKAAEEKAAAEKAAAEADPAKAEADKLAAEKADAEKKRADDLFKDSPSLPQGASPKSSEAFASIKIKATQEISAREARIEELNKRVQELEAKSNAPVPTEVENELKSLREWRTKLDVEIDPKFKQYDKDIASASEFIYSQLKKSPKVTDAVINEIKSHGGPHKVEITEILKAIGDPTIQRMVDSKLTDIEHILFNREQAIKAAKENITGYMADRQKEVEAIATQHNKSTEAVLKQHLPKLNFLQKKEIPAGSDEATRKSIEAHNKFADETNKSITEALNDDSPEMRAILLLGMGKLLHVQPLLDAANAKVAKLEKDLKEATAQIEKFKGASVSRLRESAVPPGGKLPEAKTTVDVNARTSDALDAAMSKVVEENARAAGNR